MTYGERLAHAPEDDFLMRDVSCRAHGMHRNAVDQGATCALEAGELGLLARRVALLGACAGNEARGADGRAGGASFLPSW